MWWIIFYLGSNFMSIYLFILRKYLRKSFGNIHRILHILSYYVSDRILYFQFDFVYSFLLLFVGVFVYMNFNHSCNTFPFLFILSKFVVLLWDDTRNTLYLLCQILSDVVRWKLKCFNLRMQLYHQCQIYTSQPQFTSSSITLNNTK